MLRRTSVSSIVLGLATVVAVTATAPTATAVPTSRVEVLMGRATTPAPLPENLAIALSAGQEHAAASPHDIAHPWADRARGVLVVPVVTRDGRSVAAALRARLAGTAGVVTTSATRSYARLEGIENAAIDLTREDVPGAGAIIATYVDARTNRVVVETNAAPPGLLTVLADRFGADAVVVRAIPGATRPEPQGRDNDISPFWGGAKIVIGNGGCTSGFPWLRNTSYRMITAGHCASSGGSVSTPAESMGTVTSGSGENWQSGTGTVHLSGQSTYRGDIARIDITSPKYAGTSIYVGATGSTSSKVLEGFASRRNAAGDSYCTGGAYSGELCGWTIATTGGNVTYPSGEIVRNVSTGTKSSPCTVNGDSGGPIYQTGTRATAIGIHSGLSAGTGCPHVFTDVWTAWDAFGGWASVPILGAGDRRTSNQILQQRHELRSPNGLYVLKMQADGNLVLYKSSTVAVWSSGTMGSSNEGAHASMQSDGNFVLYRPGSVAIWSTNTSGQTGAHIRLQDDCNLVVYRTNGTAAWASNTANC